MSIRKSIVDVFQDEYLLAKILSLTKIKGIESDLRFLLERSFYSHEGKIPETEVLGRTDLMLTLEPAQIIEIKCYHAVITTKDTQDRRRNDLLSLSKHTSTPTKVFLYFGLYGNAQPPVKKSLDTAERIGEIKQEIEKILNIAKAEDIKIISCEYYDKVLPDRILYAAWFYVN